MTEPKPNQTNKEIKCECETPNCKRGLIITKYPERKIKIRIFNEEKIGSVVVSRKKLMEKLKELK